MHEGESGRNLYRQRGVHRSRLSVFDVDGTIDGVPGACIAPMCTAGDVVACQGSSALVCNGSGDGFTTQSCVNGCAAPTGCLACLANQTSCVNGTLSTCDGSGHVAASMACAVGCSADATRCATMVPSNALADALTMVVAPPDLDLENGTLNILKGGTFTPDGGSAVALPIIGVDAPDGGQALSVIVAHTITLNNVKIVASSDALRADAALAVIATGDIHLTGTNTVTYPGFTGDEQCLGAAHGTGADGSFSITTGAGGGGFGTIGGDGGGIAGVHPGIGGAVSGNDTLVPLRGGCDGGYEHQSTLHFSFGGGAVQLSSLTQVVVDGTIIADAGIQFDKTGTGGGAGGAILIEAPVVMLSSNAALLTRGAGGAAGDGTVGVTQNDALSDPGGLCQGLSDQMTCSAGGAGASPTQAAQNGTDFNGTTGTANVSSGGGGGGLGRIRINTGNGTFTPGASTLIAGALTIGMVLTQ